MYLPAKFGDIEIFKIENTDLQFWSNRHGRQKKKEEEKNTVLQSVMRLTQTQKYSTISKFRKLFILKYI